MAESKVEAGKQLLLRLPNELLENILFDIPDASTLASAALSCRLLYGIFKRNEDTLVDIVLKRCVGVTVLPEALLALECTPPILSTDLVAETDWNTAQVAAQHDYISRFLCHNMYQGRQPRSKYTMRTAIALCDFHTQVVRPLQKRFITSRTDFDSELCFPKLRESLQARPLSQLEKERISRNLYRFEIYRKLYGCSRLSYPFSGRSEDFFLQYSGWELAELSCIHDFLAHEIIPIYADVVASDIAWGAQMIEYDVGVEHAGIQHLLTTGLTKILEVVTLGEGSYSARAAALTTYGKRPVRYKQFLLVDMEKLNYRIARDAPLRSSRKYDDLASGRPFCEDGDEGSRKIWLRESYRQDDNSDNRSYRSVRDELSTVARAWGYVLWDQERHQDLVSAQTWMHSWEHVRPKGSDGRPVSWEDLTPANSEAWHPHLTIPDMKPSWADRARLYAAGFRGHREEAARFKAYTFFWGMYQSCLEGIKGRRTEKSCFCS